MPRENRFGCVQMGIAIIIARVLYKGGAIVLQMSEDVETGAVGE